MELYSDPANNPLGSGEDEVAGYEEIYTHWRTIDQAPNGQQVLADAVMDLGEPVGAMCAFVAHPDHATGALKVVHGPRTYTTVPGRPSPA